VCVCVCVCVCACVCVCVCVSVCTIAPRSRAFGLEYIDCFFDLCCEEREADVPPTLLNFFFGDFFPTPP